MRAESQGHRAGQRKSCEGRDRTLASDGGRGSEETSGTPAECVWPMDSREAGGGAGEGLSDRDRA